MIALSYSENPESAYVYISKYDSRTATYWLIQVNELKRDINSLYHIALYLCLHFSVPTATMNNNFNRNETEFEE